ncbi:MAG: hypothetical protein J7499_16960 [Sphingopyxis sp.]|nr:hypothetical protein [Sphingopyxis sp.]
MTRHRPFRFLLLLVAALLLAAGPGSPLCTMARAAETGTAAMADCGMSAPAAPAKQDGLHIHPDCASPCIGIDVAAPVLEPVRPGRNVQFAAALPRLEGIRPLPEIGPPRL